MDTEARLAQARWLLGLLYPEQVPAFACSALEAGFDSPSLRLLAGESQPTRAAIAPIVESVFRELGIPPLDEEEAKLVVGRDWAARIVAGATSPYEGAKAIWRECCDLDPPRHRLDVFLSLASEHEDFRFAQLSAPDRYEDEIRETEEKIVEEARRLLESAA